MIRADSGFVAFSGPGLPEDVDETPLTANALWEAVTEDRNHRTRAGAWIDRSNAADSP